MKILSFVLFVFSVLGVNLFAQQKVLTLSEAVLGQRKLSPDRLSGVKWRPELDHLVYNQGDSVLVELDVVKGTESKLLRLKEVQSLNKAVVSFGGYEWKSKNELFLRAKEEVLVYHLVDKQLNGYYTSTAEMQNLEVHPTSPLLAFTKGNNVFVKKGEGTEIQVTFHSEEGIVAGQSIARNEFGISKGLFWSNSGKYLAFYEKDERNIASYPIVDVTTTPATVKPIKYPMAGSASEKPRVGIYNLETKTLLYIQPRKGEDNYLTNLSWSPDDSYVLLAEVSRSQDVYWLNRFLVDGSFANEVLSESSQQWVEPEHPAYFPSENANEFIWVSEKDGFNNLYLYSKEGKLLSQLTKNKFVTKRIVRSLNKGQDILFVATGTSALNNLYYSVNRKGIQTCLTLEEGVHNLLVSSSGNYYYDEFSSHSVPYKALVKTKIGKELKVLKISEDKLQAYKIGTTEIGQIKGKDGSVLYTRLIKPSDFDEKKKYPVLIYVYGGPHAQMITNSWLDGASLWMQWMAEKGYLIFTLDNRGSAERGVAFESQIHRQLGTVELEDQLSGVEYLKHLSYVDTNRLAVHGWSFGGFMTNTMMLKAADVFKVGVAGGPVTDWKWYEAMYGERYMDRPEENAAGYLNASLFSHTSKLKGKLLLIHGTADDVVVLQHNEALVKKFIEDGKQVDFFPYPMHLHNVFGKDRVHLMEKVLTYIIDNNK